MPLYISSLNSGSNGNCYYIGNSRDAILVDAGLSCRETERILKALELDIKKIRAIFISHEHSDHIKGVATLSAKYHLPVYVTSATAIHGKLSISRSLQRSFSASASVSIGSMEIVAFSKIHDAADPHSFVIRDNEVTVGVFTDIGKPCNVLAQYFRECNAAFLEANYDEEMLENGAYPFFLKNRIRGGYGHLSNRQALEVFIQYRSPSLSHLLLSHLSKDNNCPLKLTSLFRPHARNTNIVIASRFAPTPVYEVRATSTIPVETSVQLSLFANFI